jgi:dihydroorotate dehydrogenase
MYALARSILFRLDAETAHGRALGALDLAHRLRLTGLLAGARVDDPVELMGLRFPNRVGLAAGLDKNADHLDALGALGFGFVEVGTVTPKPQAGNPKPRLFRLPERGAIINRMGFNNAGVDHLVARVREARFDGVIGINIGKNLTTPVERAVDDYLLCLEKVHAHADYVTVNISSPNTPGLRSLQFGEQLDALLGTLREAGSRLDQAAGRRVPLAVKIAPDMSDDEVGLVAGSIARCGIDAVIATNTTISREAVAGLPHADEQGGLSGGRCSRLPTGSFASCVGTCPSCRSSAWAASTAARRPRPSWRPAPTWCSSTRGSSIAARPWWVSAPGRSRPPGEPDRADATL